MKEWLREYAAGAGWELYRVAISPFFEGTSFSRFFSSWFCVFFHACNLLFS
jgi:hypothetical protein